MTGTTRAATYRLQLRAEFGFDQAAGLIDYLAGLGISDVYCSPILQAAPGSTHGYDVVDHSRISADLGGETGLERLTTRLSERGTGLTLDIVPNHMAIDGRANRWWWDVLENGPSSRYASYFDIDWPRDGHLEPTVLVPVLADRYGTVLERREVRLHREGGTFFVTYFDHELPVSPRTVDTILLRAAEDAGSEDTGAGNLADLAGEFGALPLAAMTDPASVSRRHDEKERLQERLAVICATETGIARAIDRRIEDINADPDGMDRLLLRQNYRLAYWRTANEELDYRRFFNIETLVGLRVEDDQVFADTHDTIGRLIHEGRASGLRVDHIDGLRDPEAYLQRLRRLAPAAYVAVEKILSTGEQLPPDWPVEGTTGYEFITRLSNAFVDPHGEEAMSASFRRITGESRGYAEVVRDAKLQIMADELGPEVERLTRRLHLICEGNRRQRDRTAGEVRDALRAVLASFPVYRTYAQPGRPLREEDEAFVATAIRSARDAFPESDPDLLGFIGELLLFDWPGGAESEFAQMFPQLSTSVMAKGAEDTAFYRYNRLVSLNEVGGDPGVFGRPLAEFHTAGADSAARRPHGMLTLATHDTKRSPDVRARISLLSEIPEHWDAAVTRWLDLTDIHSVAAGPDANARYLLFQTLVGTWPIETERLVAYMEKASKEAKLHTSWTDPDPDYDHALRKFVEATMSDERFAAELEGFLDHHRIPERGRATSLSQLALLLTCPGIPDIYQGTETWDHSLVDPDNRRPVDYDALQTGLRSVDSGTWPSNESGTVAKLWLTARLLRHRRDRPSAYAEGGYEPLEVRGPKAGHVIAFSRGDVMTISARHLVRLDAEWEGTAVEVPAGRWQAVAGGSSEPASGGFVPVADILGLGPAAVLERSKRG